MPPPANYDSAGLVIRVDPTALWGYAQTDMPAEAHTVSDALGRINTVWQGLALGWAGTTADEAQDFNDRWNAALGALFGTPEAPDSGALPKIAYAVGMAALNYGGTEDVVKTMFDTFAGELRSSGPQPPARNNGDSPITENTPPYTMPPSS
jgi:hypothetical protein